MTDDTHKELEVTNGLLAETERVLHAIPECPLHGNRCVPHALEWIESAKAAVGRESPTNFQVPPGWLAPGIERWGNKWRCAWVRPTRSIMGMVGLGDTPNEAFASWFKKNTARGRDNPWSGP